MKIEVEFTEAFLKGMLEWRRSIHLYSRKDEDFVQEKQG
jgi:hypothetical protein